MLVFDPSEQVRSVQLYGIDPIYIGKAVEILCGDYGVGHVDIPVLGNGDVWEAVDAIDLVTRSGCAGVVVGRGCLGRPWLFRDLAAAFAGEPAPPLPTLGEVAVMMR